MDNQGKQQASLVIRLNSELDQTLFRRLKEAVSREAGLTVNQKQIWRKIATEYLSARK